MKFKSLLDHTDIRNLKAADLELPSIPADGQTLLSDIAARFAGARAAHFRRNEFGEDVELSSHNRASSLWYSDRKIRALVWTGDLEVHGDLIDDDFAGSPVLVVRGNLTVRSWLRGGMPSFVTGSVKASGYIVGHFNDGPLFVGGDLSASGYITRAKPYHDVPHVIPHQIAGCLDARRFDALDASDQSLRETFVDDVLTEDEEAVYLDEKAILQRAKAAQTVWR